MDHDIVQGEEEQGIQEEEGGKIKFMSLAYSQVPCVLPFMRDLIFISYPVWVQVKQTCNLKPEAQITLVELTE